MNMQPLKRKLQFKNIGDLPVKITDWIGSTSSIVVHTILFVGIFVLRVFKFTTTDILLILTTAVSLEAIYLAIFIQMTVNRNTQSLEEVEEDIDEIQLDIDRLEEEDVKDNVHDTTTIKTLDTIQLDLQKLMQDIQHLKEQKK